MQCVYRLCNKLSRQQIDISSFGTMKRRFAEQVMSETVATALELNYGCHITETVNFIRHVNKFFDCLNTRNLGEAACTKNANIRGIPQ